MPPHLTTWTPNNMTVRDLGWYPVDIKPNDPIVMVELLQLAFFKIKVQQVRAT